MSNNKITKDMVKEVLGYTPSTYVDVCKAAEIMKVDVKEVYKAVITLPNSNMFD